MNSKKIIQVLKENKDEILHRFHLKAIAVFGSVAKNTFRKGSDLDIMIEPLDQTIFSYSKLLALEAFLKNLVPVDRIDIVNSRYFNPLIKAEAEKDFIYV